MLESNLPFLRFFLEENLCYHISGSETCLLNIAWCYHCCGPSPPFKEVKSKRVTKPTLTKVRSTVLGSVEAKWNISKKGFWGICVRQSPYQPCSPKNPDPTKSTLWGFYGLERYIYTFMHFYFCFSLILKVLFFGVYISVAFEFCF